MIVELVRSSLRRPSFMLLALFSVGYFAMTGLLATQKLFWFDELFTWHLSRLPSLVDLWQALAAGVDLNPPLSYLLVRASNTLVGAGPLATRLPAMIGFWLMLLAVYTFVSRRCGPLYGWIALLVPLATWAYPNAAYEARPYGLVLGCCGLSLISWQRAAEQDRRGGSLLEMSLSLMVAVSCHYYAVLLFIPIGLGELTRTAVRRRVDWLVWLALIAGLVPLAACAPLIQLARGYAASHSDRAGWGFPHEFYSTVFGRMALPLLALLCLAALLPRRVWSSAPEASSRESAPLIPLHEAVAALGLLALPLFGMILARFGSGAFALRYALPAAAGFAIVLAIVLHRLTSGSRVVGGSFLVVLLGWSLAVQLGEYQRISSDREHVLGALAFLSQQERTAQQPIAITGPMTFLQMSYYAPKSLAQGLVYVGGADVAERYDQQQRYSLEGALLSLSRHAPLNVTRYEAIANQPDRILIYGFGKLTSDLEANGVRFTVVNHHNNEVLLSATAPPRPIAISGPLAN